MSIILPKSFIVPPIYIRGLFTETIWETNDKSVLFTFDDGPFSKSNEIILQWLQKKGIHGHFFVNGSGDKGAMREIVQSGHTLGNHLFHHKRAIFMNRKEIEDSIIKTNEIIEDISGCECAYFRPPYGIPFTGMAAMMKKLRMKTVMWSLLSWDFRYDTETVSAIHTRYISAGSIIVLHNNPTVVSKIETILEHSFALIQTRNLVIGNPETCLK